MTFHSTAAGGLIQTAQTVDTTARSTTSGTLVDMGVAVALTGVRSTSRVRLRAAIAVGVPAPEGVILDIRRGGASLFPAGTVGGGCLYSTLGSVALEIDDTTHGGGDLSWSLYWRSTGGALARVGAGYSNNAITFIAEEIR